jgi:lysozyme
MAFWSKPNPAHPTVVNTPAKKASWIGLAVVLVGGFEGLYLHPYRDIAGVLTVCYGATAADHVDLTRSYTKQECDDMLGADLPKYDAMIQKCISKDAYNDLQNHPHRHVALVSFVYNLGPGPVCKGAIGRDLNRGNISAACHDLLAYNRARVHGVLRPVKGLTDRRTKEVSWCIRND